MKAKLAYLTTPAPGVFILNIQVGDGPVQRFEISKAHLSNILIDGASVALREYSQNEEHHERTSGRWPQ
jgi:hypothetical protein